MSTPTEISAKFDAVFADCNMGAIEEAAQRDPFPRSELPPPGNFVVQHRSSDIRQWKAPDGVFPVFSMVFRIMQAALESGTPEQNAELIDTTFEHALFFRPQENKAGEKVIYDMTTYNAICKGLFNSEGIPLGSGLRQIAEHGIDQCWNITVVGTDLVDKKGNEIRNFQVNGRTAV